MSQSLSNIHPVVTLSKIFHKGEFRILLKFAYSETIIETIKDNLDNAVWSKTWRGWHIPYSKTDYSKAVRILSPLTQILTESTNEETKSTRANAMVKVDEEKEKFITKFIEPYRKRLVTARYSANTIKTYCNAFSQFIKYFYPCNPDLVSSEQIKEYMFHLAATRKLSASFQNQVINAIKYYFEHVLHRPKEYYDLVRAKKSDTLPAVLSEREIAQLLSSIKNLKHKTIIAVIYSGGLRISEAINLKIADIDSDRMVIHIRQAKGAKDRMVMLSEKILEILRLYYKQYNPSNYLFEGPDKSSYSAKSIQTIFQRARIAAKINKKVTVHSLRHSFATHLLEQGIQIRVIQELLGHNSIKTTERYTHIARASLGKVKSPLDKITWGMEDLF